MEDSNISEDSIFEIPGPEILAIIFSLHSLFALALTFGAYKLMIKYELLERVGIRDGLIALTSGSLLADVLFNLHPMLEKDCDTQKLLIIAGIIAYYVLDKAIYKTKEPR